MNSNHKTPLLVTVADPSAAVTADSTTASTATQKRTKAGTIKPTAAALVRTLEGMPEMHDLADLFPPMSARAKAALSVDIKENGQQVPIVLWEGKVNDGRHRAQVCFELGLPIQAIDYEGELDPPDLVWSLNASRRDITQSQLGIVAALKRNYPRKGGRLPVTKKILNEGQNEVGNLTDFVSERAALTTKQAAQAVGVDPRTVTSGNTVCASKNSRLIEAVKAGHIAIEPAAKIARQLKSLSQTEQDLLVERALKLDDGDELVEAEKRLRARVKNALLQGKSIPDCELHVTVVEAAVSTFLEAHRQVKAAISAVKLLEEGERPDTLIALLASCKALAKAAS